MDRLLLLKRRIRSGYVLSFLLLLFSFCLIFYVQQRLVKESDSVMHSYEVINETETLKSELTRAETGLRGYLLTRNQLFLEDYSAGLTTVPQICHHLKTLTADNPEQQQNILDLEQWATKRLNRLLSALDEYQNNGNVVSESLKQKLDLGVQAMDSTRMQILKVTIAENKLMDARKHRLSGFFNGAKWMAIIALTIVFLALLYSDITFNREYKAKEKAAQAADRYRADLESKKNELEQKNIELKELKDLEKFTSTGRIARTIAHEVRNPLTNILLATEQLKETEAANEENTVLLDLINRNAARINQLVSDLLNATRFSHLDFAETNINELVDETLESAKDRIELNHVRVEKAYRADGCCPPVDKEKMKVALLNIIVNAIEAMEKGKGVLHLSTRQQDNKCIIEIKDNGKGMDDETRQKLFEPYFTTKMKGHGLGLTNTQNIILNHNGNIRVFNKESGGSEFVVTLDMEAKPE